MHILKIFLFAVLAFTAATSLAQDVLSEIEFRDRIADEIRANFPSLCINAVDASTLQIGETSSSCNDVALNTGYKYSQYSSNEESLDILVSDMVTTFVGIQKSLEDESGFDPLNLVIQLRPKSYISYIENINLGGDDKTSPEDRRLIWKPFAGDIVAIMMINSPTTLTSVTSRHLSDNNLSESKAWEAAEIGLINHLGELDTYTEIGVTAVSANSGLATGKLWQPNTCVKTSAPFAAYLVDRDTYFTAPLDNNAAYEVLAQVATDMAKDKGGLSDKLLVCENGQWSALELKNDIWIPLE